MAPLSAAYSGKRVFVTGHTGFKGSWLCAWLLELGADVTGYSLPPPTRPALFTQLRMAPRLRHIVGDVRDVASLSKAVVAAKPDYLFHLAAQPIVQGAHDHPSDTWSTNVMGTVNVLEALRGTKGACAAVIVTTDKVYGRRTGPYAENHALGGAEPYGASKAAAELAVEAWRASYFAPMGSDGWRAPRVALATARAGNVIGGGDWAPGRLLPDIARALKRGRRPILRNPEAIRPWQHVLDPLSGYLALGARLREGLSPHHRSSLATLSGPFNFGPAPADHRSVRDVAREVFRHWPGEWAAGRNPLSRTAADVLRLSARKARTTLGWRPRWNFEMAVLKTVEWYRAVDTGTPAAAMTLRQLGEHQH